MKGKVIFSESERKTLRSTAEINNVAVDLSEIETNYITTILQDKGSDFKRYSKEILELVESGYNFDSIIRYADLYSDVSVYRLINFLDEHSEKHELIANVNKLVSAGLELSLIELTMMIEAKKHEVALQPTDVFTHAQRYDHLLSILNRIEKDGVGNGSQLVAKSVANYLSMNVIAFSPNG